MAGIIKREDIDEVRQRTNLKDIVDSQVTLKRAGIDSYKGLCPFHDERTPSFVVRPQVGRYHCFGCGKSGDAYSFIQEMERLTFSEAVEKLASRLNYPLHYEQGGRPGGSEPPGIRQRMFDAHKLAAEYFQEQLLTAEASKAREFLRERKFSKLDAEHFGVGYAPRGWDMLLKYLSSKGFVHEELKSTGMFSTGERGLYDRFRGRIVWPIRDITGVTIGFGARRLYDEDQGPKYLNTPETVLYKKSQVLYGLDLARKHISGQGRLVVVEGYTDVMAAHLAGIRTAVASCGTAFGEGHVKLARRLLADNAGAEIIFTFDGDEAGRNAALQVFKEDEKFLAQTFVAIEPTGKDPCDLRIISGDDSVVELVESRRPLFEFVLKTAIARCDVTTIEGRAAAVKAASPIVATIKDVGMQSEYIREVSMRVGVSLERVGQAVREALRNKRTPAQGGASDAPLAGDGQEGAVPREKPYRPPDVKNHRIRKERDVLEVVVQLPEALSPPAIFERFKRADFVDPTFAEIAQAVIDVRSGGEVPQAKVVAWVQKIKDKVSEIPGSLVEQLAIRELPVMARDSVGMTHEMATRRYTYDIFRRFFIDDINHKKEEKMLQMQRYAVSGTATEEQLKAFNKDLLALEKERRALENI